MKSKNGFLWFLFVGVVALAMGCSTMKGEREERKEKEDEVKVSIEQVPAAVKATILREAAGKKIEEIERTGTGSEAEYEAEFLENGREVEIRVAANGAVLSREVDDEDDEREESVGGNR